MKRIMVIGVSSGVGKSTFAKELGKVLHIEVYHLDSLFWKPGWVESYLDEFASSQKRIMDKEEWILEGNYTNTFDLRMAQADTMIYLELPLYICLFRVIKRFINYFGKTRPDIGEGCPEKLDWSFIKFILTTYRPRKDRMQKHLEDFMLTGANRTTIILKNKKDIESFLNKLRS
jgi:adenylate kinase family enzyme